MLNGDIMKKKNTNNKTMKISFRIEDEYGNIIQNVNGLPLDKGIGKLKGTLNTKLNRKSGKEYFRNMMKGL